MTKYKVIYHYADGEIAEEDELFDSEEEATDAGNEGCSGYELGGEILHMSNPGDYPIKENDEVEFEIVEVEE